MPDTCPRCGADECLPFPGEPGGARFVCGSKITGANTMFRTDTCKLNQIIAYAQRHASPAVVTPVHKAMNDILRMAEARE